LAMFFGRQVTQPSQTKAFIEVHMVGSSQIFVSLKCKTWSSSKFEFFFSEHYVNETVIFLAVTILAQQKMVIGNTPLL
jgi:hypothetical protein